MHWTPMGFVPMDLDDDDDDDEVNFRKSLD